MSQLRLSIVAIALTTAFATNALAQDPTGFGRPTAGIFGGISLPNGDFNDEVGTGFHGGALFKMRVYKALDARIDGTFTKFAEKKIVGTIASVETYGSVIQGTLNALLNLGPDSASYPGDNSVSPYILGGFGEYRLNYDAECSGQCTDFIEPGKHTHFGLNIGGGASVPFLGLRTFVEARYHRISRKASEGSPRKMVLVSVGLKFR
jgi:hypothetical protein